MSSDLSQLLIFSSLVVVSHAQILLLMLDNDYCVERSTTQDLNQSLLCFLRNMLRPKIRNRMVFFTVRFDILLICYAVADVRTCCCLGGIDGSLYTLVPVRDAVFRRLQSLQATMSRHILHFGGLNPRGYRYVTPSLAPVATV